MTTIYALDDYREVEDQSPRGIFERAIGKQRIAKLYAALGPDWQVNLREIEGEPISASVDWKPALFISHGECDLSEPVSMEDQLAEELRNFARVLTDAADRIENGQPWTMNDRPSWLNHETLPR